MRLNDIAIKNMIMNNAAKMFEPLLVRKYKLEGIKVRGDSIFLGDLLLCRVYGLSNAYNNKGSALFDAKEFKGVNIIVDEFALEKNQRKSFVTEFFYVIFGFFSANFIGKTILLLFFHKNTPFCPCSMHKKYNSMYFVHKRMIF